jgi:hypothetical protein
VSVKVADKDRVLRFPQDRSVGWVKVPKAGPDPHNNWHEVGSAVGDVVIPIDTPVRLIVEPSASRDLSWLEALQPNDLHELNLAQTYVNGDRLFHVARLTGLQALSLAHPNATIGDVAMAQVQPLTQLRRLSLSATSVGDAGLSYLRELSRLEVLDIGATEVTDAGLPCLYNLHRLREVSFETAYSGGAACLVTAAGRTLLQKALPHCVLLRANT